MKKIIKNGKINIYTSKINLNLDLKKFEYEFIEKGKEQISFHQIFNNIVSSSEEEILRKVKPIIEEKISTRIISVCNNIFRHNRLEELFPERT